MLTRNRRNDGAGAPGPVRLLTLILRVFPEVGAVRLTPGGRSIVLEYLLSKSPSTPMFREFLSELRESCSMLHELTGVVPGYMQATRMGSRKVPLSYEEKVIQAPILVQESLDNSMLVVHGKNCLTEDDNHMVQLDLNLWDDEPDEKFDNPAVNELLMYFSQDRSVLFGLETAPQNVRVVPPWRQELEADYDSVMVERDLVTLSPAEIRLISSIIREEFSDNLIVIDASQVETLRDLPEDVLQEEEDNLLASFDNVRGQVQFAACTEPEKAAPIPGLVGTREDNQILVAFSGAFTP